MKTMITALAALLLTAGAQAQTTDTTVKVDTALKISELAGSDYQPRPTAVKVEHVDTAFGPETALHISYKPANPKLHNPNLTFALSQADAILDILAGYQAQAEHAPANTEEGQDLGKTNGAWKSLFTFTGTGEQHHLVITSCLLVICDRTTRVYLDDDSVAELARLIMKLKTGELAPPALAAP